MTRRGFLLGSSAMVAAAAMPAPAAPVVTNRAVGGHVGVIGYGGGKEFIRTFAPSFDGRGRFSGWHPVGLAERPASLVGQSAVVEVLDDLERAEHDIVIVA